MMHMYERPHLKIIRACIVLAVVGILMGISILYTYNSGFFLLLDAGKFLPFYLGHGSILFKLFDYMGNDWLYRARELGNIFNYLDAELIRISFRLGFGHFLSIVHYVCLLLIILIHYRNTQKYFGSSVFPIFLVFTVLFLTSPAPFFSGFYFRTSKIIVSLLVTLLFWLTYGLLARTIRKSNNWRSTVTQSVAVGGLALVMMLVDEQGIGLIVWYTAIVAMCSLFLRTKLLISTSFSLVCALVLAQLWRANVGPYLTYRITGDYPVLWTVARVPGLDISRAIQSVRIFLLYISLLFGNTGVLGGTLILLFTFFVYAKSIVIRYTRRGVNFLFAYIPLIVIFISGILMSIAMIYLESLNHGDFLLPDLAIMYYPLPLQTVWFLVISVGCYCFNKRFPKSLPVVTGILGALVILNVTSLPNHDSFLRNSSFFKDDYGLTPSMLRAISDRKYPLSEFNGSYQWNVIKVIRERLIE